MTRRKPPRITVESFTDHQVITQPNPLRKLVRQVEEDDTDDAIARAEQALADLAGEFTDWMRVECERLGAAHDALVRNGLTPQTREELFRAAHDIKGGAATFGYPSAAAAAESLCRIIEHAPDLTNVPDDLILHHVNAVQAIVREQNRRDAATTATELSDRLRDVADEYLIHANRDRPEHLEAVLAPSIVPDE
jgi:HPt (histidine-containing phosphotransfer) domain-containing protein